MRIKFLFFFLLSACTSVPLQSSSSRTKLDLNAVQSLSFGKISQTELIKILGAPDEVIPLKRDLKGRNALIYYEDENGQRIQRLGILVDAKSGTVLSGTWGLREDEPLRAKDNALAHFGRSGFTGKKVSPVAKHYYSDNTVYSNPTTGISLYLSGPKQQVESISFDEVQRDLAKK